MSENPAYDKAMKELAAGTYDRAQRSFVAALKAEPERPRIHANLGELHRRRGALDKARKSAQRAVELDAEDAYGWRVLAAIAHDGDEHDAAWEAAERCRSLTEHPALLADATRYLAWALINLDRWREAHGVLREYLESAPDDDVAIECLAVALAHGTYWGDAVEVIGEARAISPDDEDFEDRERTLGQGLFEVRGTLARALTEAKKSDADADAWHDLAKLQAMAGQHDEAVKSFDEARARHPDDRYRDADVPAMLSACEADVRLGLPGWRPSAWGVGEG